MPPPVFRFAPSPNGYLHLGHAYSALLNFDLARQARRTIAAAHRGYRRRRAAGRNSRPRSIEDLAWLGIAWETPVRRQSEHLADYRDALEKLVGAGPGLSELREPRRDRATGGAARGERRRWPRDPDGAPLYPGAAKSLPPASARGCFESGAPYALRLDMAAACARAGDLGWIEHGEGPDGETGAVAARPQAWGDVILARKETPTSYHLSVVIDDALQGVTDVVRGPGPVLVDQRASAAAATARPAAAGLPASPAGPRRRRAQAVEIDRGHRLARTARRRARRRPTSAAWSACRDCLQFAADRKPKTPPA